MSKTKVDKLTERAIFLGKKTIFALLIIIFSLTLFAFSCEDAEATELTEEEKIEARERLDVLLEKTEVLFLLLENKFKRGELPSSANIPTGEPYIKEYIALGANNKEEEVRKLQSFLNEHMNESLLVNGFYDNATFEAVKRFQLKYAEEILHPWGINYPTGFVYLTTQRKINALQKPDQYFPMPTNLVPYSKVIVYDDPVSTLEKEEEQEEDKEEVEIEDESSVEVVDTEDTIIEKTEEEKRNVFLWIVIALSSVSFLVIIFYLFFFDNRKESKKKPKKREKEEDQDKKKE